MSEIVKGSSRVPEWNTYYPSLSHATKEQRQFYEFWKDNLERGPAINIDGNLSYLFVYIYEAIEKFIVDKNIDQLLEGFEKIRQGYGKSEQRIEIYLSGWASDAWHYLKKYDECWEAARSLNRLRLSDILDIRAKCTNTAIDGRDLLRILGNNDGLTPFGKGHREEIANLASVFLEDFHKEHDVNFIEFFCRQFDYSNLTDNDLSKLETFFTNARQYKSLRKKVLWKQNHRLQLGRQSERGKLYLFAGVPTNNIPPSVELKEIPTIIEAALTHEGKRIVRECENTLREESDLPKVGEGWIAEAELFYKLHEAFPDEKIVHHGRPSWLDPQHLDVYFTGQNVGCEYQGAQHQNPVSYFGGEASFLKQMKRDKRKKSLCTKHGCKLIYIYEGYNFETVRGTVKKLFLTQRRI